MSNQSTTMSIGVTQIAFELFDLISADAATTESITLYNTRSFEIIAFRAALSVAGRVNFYESIDGTNRFARSVYHIEANAFVTSVLAFTSGNFIAVVAGIQNFQIEKVTASAGTRLTFVGRSTFGRGTDGGVLGPAGPDDKDYIDCLAGPNAQGTPATVSVFKADISTSAAAIVAYVGPFPSLDTAVNGATIDDDDGVFAAIDFQFRDVTADAFHYAPPETRPVLRMEVLGGATNTDILYGFSLDISAVDFADVVGIGLSVMAVSNYDYSSNSGLLHPGTANRNYARTQLTIRDSAGVAIWQANKLDIPFNGTAVGRVDAVSLDVNSTHTLGVVVGTASEAYPRLRYEPTVVSSWVSPGDTPKADGIIGSIIEYRNPATKYYDLEFSLERHRVTDSMEGFYQSPTGYDIDGNPDDAVGSSPSAAITWDFSDAATLYFSRTLALDVGSSGEQLSADMADAGGLSNAGGEGFPNPPGSSPDPERQTLYVKDVFLRRRPFSYPICTNYSIDT